MIKTKVTQTGQSVVPAEIRKIFGIDRDSILIWETDGKTITVIPSPRDPIQRLKGFSKNKNLRKALMRSRKEDEHQR
jgi:bifunctional DNA-binding transcriptional regulator/antitoxin component of YhaV-PrlF toxin-antitoxin module